MASMYSMTDESIRLDDELKLDLANDSSEYVQSVESYQDCYTPIIP